MDPGKADEGTTSLSRDVQTKLLFWEACAKGGISSEGVDEVLQASPSPERPRVRPPRPPPLEIPPSPSPPSSPSPSSASSLDSNSTSTGEGQIPQGNLPELSVVQGPVMRYSPGSDSEEDDKVVSNVVDEGDLSDDSEDDGNDNSENKDEEYDEDKEDADVDRDEEQIGSENATPMHPGEGADDQVGDETEGGWGRVKWDVDVRARAATDIQRVFRGHHARRQTTAVVGAAAGAARGLFPCGWERLGSEQRLLSSAAETIQRAFRLRRGGVCTAPAPLNLRPILTPLCTQRGSVVDCGVVHKTPAEAAAVPLRKIPQSLAMPAPTLPATQLHPMETRLAGRDTALPGLPIAKPRRLSSGGAGLPRVTALATVAGLGNPASQQGRLSTLPMAVGALAKLTTMRLSGRLGGGHRDVDGTGVVMGKGKWSAAGGGNVPDRGALVQRRAWQRAAEVKNAERRRFNSARIGAL